MAAVKQKVLILGGGFGGVKAALELADSAHFEVSLISDHDDFRYYPTLYKAATGASPLAASIPLAEIFKSKDIKIIEDQALKLDRDKKQIISKAGKKYTFDHLIISLGVVTNYFHIKGLDTFSYGIKSLEEATRLRDHLHQQITDDGRPDLNYIIIGGGPTGVELASALPGYLRRIMRNHGLDERHVHIDLVEAMPRLMPSMPKPYSRAVAKRLRRLGVRLYLQQMVKAETADELTVGDHNLKSHTVIWTAGVASNPFLAANDFDLTDRGRAVVDQYMQAEDNIYVIGDNADSKYSGMAQTALHDGLFVAKNLKRLAHGQRPRPYEPRRPVYITPVGPGWAAVQWGQLQIYGWLGWLLRNAADYLGYHDLEPWWRASEHWLAESQKAETCPICLVQSA